MMMQAEYHRFLQTLGNDNLQDVRKVANIVLQHWDVLLPLTTIHGQRVRKWVELAQSNWETVSADIQPVPAQAMVTSNAIQRLKSLEVGPFRGFAKLESFDLDSSLVLIYGPNGTGKSSFCEALEYGLLGSVADAESKRFRELDAYLKNAYTNTFTAPVIYAMDCNGQEVIMQSNDAVYRFCFIEKNRIDNFSRIAAQTPAKQTELISTLFGLDSFNGFVRNFSAEIDSRYIDFDGQKALDLEKKRLSLAGHKLLLQNSIKELETLKVEENKVAKGYREGITFAEMVLELRGDDSNTGLIKSIGSELQQQLAVKSGLTRENLYKLEHAIRNKLARIAINEQALTEEGQQVSFQQLYEAVSQVQSSSPEHCPACNTPLLQVVVNPYTRASDELNRLKYLAELQQDLKQLKKEVHNLRTETMQVVATCVERLSSNNLLNAYLIRPESEVADEWWSTLHSGLIGDITPWQQIEIQVQALEKEDQLIEYAAQQRTNKQQQLNSLQELDTKITQLLTRKTTANSNADSANEVITKFETDNAQLIADATIEKAVVIKNRAIANAYDRFVTKLNQYKNKLPEQLIADLGIKVVELYNAFNRNDLPSEKIANLRLPLNQNQRLEIAFETNATQYYDALHVLSEGHIRCLGLAILLAKNLKENCPILIFDDPVNAIDDDHRESIRRTLFEDSFFSNKQIILLCHGEEFFKDTQNILPAERNKQAKLFTFLPRVGEPHIRVDFNCAPRNYIISARQHFDRGEIRDALAKARQALEVLAKSKLWPYLNRYGVGDLSIKKRSENSPIELRNLAEQIKSKISKTDFQGEKKDILLLHINNLLGRNGESREWRYLNKGTHEEANRAEFDRASVSQIISALEQIDNFLGG